MKKIFSFAVALVAAVSCVALTAGCGGKPVTVKEIQERGELIVATNAEFEPFEYKEGDKFVGVDIEIAQKLADKLGVELRIDNMDFDAVVTSVGQGKADIALAGLTVNEERKASVDFSTSYYRSAQYLVVMKDNTAFDGLDKEGIDAKIAEMGSSAKIGYQNGTTGGMYANGSEAMEFEGFASAVKKGYPNGGLAAEDMMNGNINIVIVDEEPAKSIVEKNPDKLKYIDVKLSDEEYAMGVRKNSPEFLEYVNDFLAEIMEDGTLDTIFAKYFA